MKIEPQKFGKIKLVVLDVDGVLTDGKIYFSAQGEAIKVFHSHDGVGIKRLLAADIDIALITGRQSPMVLRRAQELGIRHVFQGVNDKLAILQQLLKQLHLNTDQVACVGDDVPDLALIKTAAIGIAVANATPEVINAADVVTQKTGGNGAVREVCELVLAHQYSPSES